MPGIALLMQSIEPQQPLARPVHKAGRVEVAMGQGVVSRAPGALSCRGLGSCVAVVLYEPGPRLGAVAHVMLPAAPTAGRVSRAPAMRFRYANTAVDALLRQLLALGASRAQLSARLVGGAELFSNDSGMHDGIGEQNLQALRSSLQREGLALSGEDTGGRNGRNLVLDLDSGLVLVTSFARPDRLLW